MTARIALSLGFIAALLAVPGAAEAKQRSAADQALYEKAMADCNGPAWPGGAKITINYGQGWYRCDSRSNK